MKLFFLSVHLYCNYTVQKLIVLHANVLSRVYFFIFLIK